MRSLQPAVIIEAIVIGAVRPGLNTLIVISSRRPLIADIIDRLFCFPQIVLRVDAKVVVRRRGEAASAQGVRLHHADLNIQNRPGYGASPLAPMTKSGGISPCPMPRGKTT